MQPATTRAVIVNADDFGQSAGVNPASSKRMSVAS